MSNHESKAIHKALYVLMAFARTKDGQKAGCMRQVVKNYDEDLAILSLRCKLAGGKWRIHRTVNLRDCEKARIWLIHKLIDYPDGRGHIESLWRTALLQPQCVYGDPLWMFDVDSKDPDFLKEVYLGVKNHLVDKTMTENGWHLITKPFDSREVCALPNVSLHRDGYVYIKTIE